MKSRIGKKIFLYMFGVAIIPMAFLYLYISSNYYDNLEDNIFVENALLQQSIVNEFEAVLNKIEFSSNISYNLGVQEILAVDVDNTLDQYNFQQQIERTFRVNLELFKVFDVISFVILENEHGNTYIIQQENNVNYELPKLSLSKDELKNHYKNFDIELVDDQFIYMRSINSIKRLGSKLGTVYIVFNIDKILDAFPGYIDGNRGYITIENDTGMTLFSNVPGDLYEKYSSNNIKVSTYYLENTKYNISFYDDVNLLLNSVRNLQKITLSILALNIILVLILAVVLSESLASPIRLLKRGISKVAEGNYDVNLDVKSKDELGELCNTFNLMANHIDVLVNEILTSKITEKEAVIAALTAQINPHFLYNTLDIVKSMAELEGQDEISEITKALSGIFRYSTKNDILVVSVEEEINNLRNYIKIIDARFGRKIKFEIDVNENVFKEKMIKLCLQPLVENSITHGLAERSYEGTIKISIVKAEDLVVEVKDNGQGIEKKELEILQDNLKSSNKAEVFEEHDGHTSVGLININRRIRLYYGDNYGLFVESQFLEGTSVTIRIPL